MGASFSSCKHEDESDHSPKSSDKLNLLEYRMNSRTLCSLIISPKKYSNNTAHHCTLDSYNTQYIAKEPVLTAYSIAISPKKYTGLNSPIKAPNLVQSEILHSVIFNQVTIKEQIIEDSDYLTSNVNKPKAIETGSQTKTDGFIKLALKVDRKYKKIRDKVLG
ncbi:Hypothetical_protein [Hexamita inflata]|uniref:Hypothetical_protein n=1 Tax=Hexamita inflata TaxID=28002 RepID=A0AA86PFF1_9EUKA|nr:Hypothetical protein HINF_LOCUS25834 [Hexamita inflata]